LITTLSPFKPEKVFEYVIPLAMQTVTLSASPRFIGLDRFTFKQTTAPSLIAGLFVEVRVTVQDVHCPHTFPAPVKLKSKKTKIRKRGDSINWYFSGILRCNLMITTGADTLFGRKKLRKHKKG
jgi:hypothetical protein